jgi:hypothetical protein
MPSWLGSLGVHAGLFALLMASFRAVPEGPVGVEEGPDRVVGLVSREYRPSAVEQADAASTETTSPSAPSPTPAPLAGAERAKSHTPVDDAPLVPLDLPRETIRPRSGLGVGPAPAVVVSSGAPAVVQGAASDVPAGGSGSENGLGRASFFGAAARGQTIAYVVDASGSMADFGAMAVAKAELAASLERLVPEQRFQIVFYNNTPRAFSPDSGRGGLPRATAVEKEKARQFLRAQQPEQGTVHIDALRMALASAPDAIFLLTDAGTAMSFRDLETVRRLNTGGCQIHTIEFGRGADLSGEENFLKKLARQHGGQYRYRDVEKFGAQK